MNKPEYVKIDEKMYKINTDFRVALECNKIALDNNISDYERALAIIYKLFGEGGLKCENKDKLLELGLKYISLGKKGENGENEAKQKYRIDFDKIAGLISSSFKYDYNYDPYEKEYLHWYIFHNDLENLSSSEFGNCCILNRIIGILDQDVSQIKETKRRSELIEIQKELKEKYCVNQEKELTKEQKESAIKFYKAIGINL